MTRKEVIGVLKLATQPSLVGALQGEHKHSGHEAIVSGAANACPICQASEIARLITALDKAKQVLMRTRTNVYLSHGQYAAIDEALDSIRKAKGS